MLLIEGDNDWVKLFPSGSVLLPSGGSLPWWACLPSTGSGIGLDLSMVSQSACSAHESKIMAPSFWSRQQFTLGAGWGVWDWAGSGVEAIVGMTKEINHDLLYMCYESDSNFIMTLRVWVWHIRLTQLNYCIFHMTLPTSQSQVISQPIFEVGVAHSIIHRFLWNFVHSLRFTLSWCAKH